MPGLMLKRTCVFCFAWLLMASCHSQPPPGDVWRESDPTFVPFEVKEIAVSLGNRFIGLTADERPADGKQTLASDFVVYLLDLKTGAHRRLGMDGLVLPALKDQLIYFESARSSRPLILTNGLDTRTLEIGEHNGGWWNPKTQTMIFESGWPQGEEGFNTLGLLDITTGKVVSVPVKEVSELVGICPTTGNLYTEHRYPKDELGVDEYDSAGKFLRAIHSPLAVYSSGCGYVLPLNAIGGHGPDDWGVFEASSGTRIMDFPWNEDGKSDLHWFREWNPHHDNLLLMYSTEASTKTDTIDVLDVRERRVIKNWPHPEGAPPIEWSSDGESVVTVRDHHVVFEPLNLEKTAVPASAASQPLTIDAVQKIVQDEFGGVFAISAERRNQKINPAFVIGDFNSNGTSDLAVLVSVKPDELHRRLERDSRFMPVGLTITKVLGQGMSAAADANSARINLAELAKEFRESILLLILPDFGEPGPLVPRFALADFCNNGEITMSVSREPLHRAAAGDAPVTNPPRLKGDALLFLDSKHEGTAVYWAEKQFLWYPVE